MRMTAPPSPPTHRAARALCLTMRAAAAGCLLAAAAMLALPLAGYQRYVITGGSMGGTIERGSVLWAKEVPTSRLRVGDVITYTPPRGAGPEGMVTHRIVSIGRGGDGAPLYRTKGDANAEADPWRFRLDNPTQARAAFHLPHAGRILAVASDRTVRMLGVGIVALLVVLATFARLWRDAGEHAGVGDERPEMTGSAA